MNLIFPNASYAGILVSSQRYSIVAPQRSILGPIFYMKSILNVSEHI